MLDPVKTPRDHTRQLVEGLVAPVPEDTYAFRPTPEVHSVRARFTPLMGENCRLMAQTADETAPEVLNGRDDRLQALKDSEDDGANVWTGMTDQNAMVIMAGRGGQPQARWAPILANILAKPGP